jgi:hypothetical protein
MSEVKLTKEYGKCCLENYVEARGNETLKSTTPTTLAIFIPSVAISVLPFAGRHAEELLVAKVFFTTFDSPEMETKASITIPLHEDCRDAATNLGFGLGVTLDVRPDPNDSH